MKVLVVEDKEMHRQSARETLQGHDITIVASFDAAMEILKSGINREKVTRLVERAGYRSRPNFRDPGYDAYRRVERGAEEESTVTLPFDVVLTDMMMPMSTGNGVLAPGVYSSDEQVPYGFVIALYAAAHGAKFVALVTDTNHHRSALSAALDQIGHPYFPDSTDEAENQQVFDICGAKTIFAHAPFVTDVIRDAPCETCKGTGACNRCQWQGMQCTCRETDKPGVCWKCRGTLKTDKDVQERKDWGVVLKFLLEHQA